MHGILDGNWSRRSFTWVNFSNQIVTVFISNVVVVVADVVVVVVAIVVFATVLSKNRSCPKTM